MSVDPARLRWRCRRGMLELDLLLSTFMERGYAALDPAERELFAGAFLALPDQELFEYLLGQAEPDDRGIARLVERVRAAQLGSGRR